MSNEIQESPIRAAINEMEGTFLLLEPASMDAAIVGLVSSCGSGDPVVCYDRSKVIAILMQDGMDEEEAEEFFEFNVIGAYMGPATPVYLTTVKDVLQTFE